VSYREELDDLITEVILRALQYEDRFDETKSKFSTWLYNIAQNYTRNYLRNKDREPELVLRDTVSFEEEGMDDCVEYYEESVHSELPLHHPSPEQEVSLDETCDSLQLSPMEARVLDLLAISGHNPLIIGVIVNKSANAVNMAVNRIKTKFSNQ
jgi:RNA polymerase sigma factor (sigma-70 family)